MSTCTIYYPGLLGPDISIEELASNEWPGSNQTRHLCKLFSIAKTQALANIGVDARILECLGIPVSRERELPVSHIRALQHDLEAEPLWCLDPVHIQIDRDEAVLLANESLNLNEQHALELIHDLNKHFEQDGLRIHYHNAHQWLLTGDIELKTNSLNDVLFRNIVDYQPTGKDTNKWRTLINEVQMLLHSHPVNEQRTMQGELTINSLWIWGGGKIDGVTSDKNIVFSDNSLVKDAVKIAGASHAALPDHLDHKYFINNNVLMIFTDQVGAVRQNDVFGWLEYLKQFDQDVLAPILSLLQKGDINKVTIVSDTISFVMTKKELHRYFRLLLNRYKTFESHIKRLRMQYDF